ncbi:MAG: MmcQ/YjbR family DNA-binding protein [Acidimicrobiia bacterium]|nr:MmcQ/YjbR family DNA-binding protein [Acidimicrobiia bacterium]
MSKESRKAQFLELAYGLPAVRRKKFAYYLDDHHGDGVVALTCKAPPGTNRALAESDPDRFFIPSYTGPRGWVGLRLDLSTVDWDEVELLLIDSYRMTAPKKLIAQLDVDRR